MNIKQISALKLKRQRGISLVEIMVAMVISIFLLGGVIQVYLANKSSYRFTDATTRIQENARFSLDTIASDLRMASYWGCAQFDASNNDHLRNNLNTASGQYNVNLHDFIGLDAISMTANDGLNGSDSITVIGSKPGQNVIRAPYMSDTDDNIEVLNTSAIEANDFVIISNCFGADIFEVSSITGSAVGGQSVIFHSTQAQTGTPGNTNLAGCTAVGTNQCLSQTYGSTAAISILQTITYSIQAGASGEPALWRSLNGVDDELIEGVEQMQILFGLDTDDDGTPNQYLADANAIAANSEQISAVRIFLVMRSNLNNITDNAQVYNLNGTDVTATDNRLRQVFSITIALRNRLR